ncbi:probable low affinity copper uptake protein 2 isoform X3 [Panthera uncia]|uniref:probable low affinity copper uptake protein 2 isoform X3 n=1 Tax=Panthera uncia TaxID=29064 RepID=UPI0020FFBDDB|nr:probable low affinity copper uptake protein 2 isoform X3 [Panthera uncia]
MHFIFSDEVVLLFDFWSVHSPAGMALSVLVVLFLAVLYESIKVGKAKLLHQAVVSVSVLSSQQLTEETDQDSSASDSAPVSRARLRETEGKIKKIKSQTMLLFLFQPTAPTRGKNSTAVMTTQELLPPPC